MNDGVDAFITLINFYILLQDFPTLHFGDCSLADMLIWNTPYDCSWCIISKHPLLDGVSQLSLFPYFNAEGGAFVNLWWFDKDTAFVVFFNDSFGQWQT